MTYNVVTMAQPTGHAIVLTQYKNGLKAAEGETCQIGKFRIKGVG